jgi:metal-responsive CopG/Arc/MetJ family transcriptional regulator
MSNLKRTQMYFPEDLLNKLKRKANNEKTTISNIVRTAIIELMKKEKVKNWDNDSLWSMVGSCTSNDKDLSVNHDKYLYGKKR